MVDITPGMAMLFVGFVLLIVTILVALGYLPRKKKELGVHHAPAKPDSWLISEKYGVSPIQEIIESPFGKRLIKLAGYETYIDDIRFVPDQWGGRNCWEVDPVGGIPGGLRYFYHMPEESRLINLEKDELVKTTHRLIVSNKAQERQLHRLRELQLEDVKHFVNTFKEMKTGLAEPIYVKKPGDMGGFQPPPM
jgi:hypothetical protein